LEQLEKKKEKWHIGKTYKLQQCVCVPNTAIFKIFLFTYFCFFETGSHYVAETGLDLMILLPPPPKCWDYKCVPSHPASLKSLLRFICKHENEDKYIQAEETRINNTDFSTPIIYPGKMGE
jgi:hypothetical protein